MTLTVPPQLWRCFQHHISLAAEDGVFWVTQQLGVGLILVGEDGVSRATQLQGVRLPMRTGDIVQTVSPQLSTVPDVEEWAP